MNNLAYNVIAEFRTVLEDVDVLDSMECRAEAEGRDVNLDILALAARVYEAELNSLSRDITLQGGHVDESTIFERDFAARCLRACEGALKRHPNALYPDTLDAVEGKVIVTHTSEGRYFAVVDGVRYFLRGQSGAERLVKACEKRGVPVQDNRVH